MRFKLHLVWPVLLCTALFGINAWGTEEATLKKTSSFTNEDIEKYKNPPESKSPAAGKDRKTEKDERAQKISEEREKEHWCKKAAPYKRKVDDTREEIRETEKELSESTLSKKRHKTLEKKLALCRKKFRSAEQDLGDIEAEAHRKGIPPGWLRCQFE